MTLVPVKSVLRWCGMFCVKASATSWWAVRCRYICATRGRCIRPRNGGRGCTARAKTHLVVGLRQLDVLGRLAAEERVPRDERVGHVGEELILALGAQAAVDAVVQMDPVERVADAPERLVVDARRRQVVLEAACERETESDHEGEAAGFGRRRGRRTRGTHPARSSRTRRSSARRSRCGTCSARPSRCPCRPGGRACAAAS